MMSGRVSKSNVELVESVDKDDIRRTAKEVIDDETPRMQAPDKAQVEKAKGMMQPRDKSYDLNENIKLGDFTVLPTERNEDQELEENKDQDSEEYNEGQSLKESNEDQNLEESKKNEENQKNPDLKENIQATESSEMEVDEVKPPKQLFALPVTRKLLTISRRIFSPTPNLFGRPLILATHLVPSFPINLFELLAEVIEFATERPVVLLHESRSNRPVAQVADIAILPANDDWQEGSLMPVSFVFEHRLNKDRSPRVYSDIVIVADRVSHVQDIIDLRGHRCALSDRHKRVGAAHLLFDHLRSKGEGPAFFGSIIDAESQLNALQIIAGKLVEVGILEAPVIKCHSHSLPGMESLRILTSLGPLPPYRFMANKELSDTLVRKITDCLLNIVRCSEWMERFVQFGVAGFAENHVDYYDLDNTKVVVTSVPYY